MKARRSWLLCGRQLVQLSLLTLTGLACAPAVAAPDCNADLLRPLAPEGVEITRTERGADFCQIEGVMRTPDTQLRFRIGLPESWNGKFLFEATGGSAGVLVDLRPAMKRGYAAATTDTGHISASSGEFEFWLDPRLRTDWIHRGVHTVTVGARALVQAYYARAAERSYLRGCSNGGRAGLMEAQRYPEDYDGIIAGAPAADPGTITLGWIWNAQVLLATPLSSADWKLVASAVRESCDARDGLKDGIIQDDRRCELPRDQLACSSGRQRGCLEPAKLQALQRLWNKPVLSDGSRLPAEGHGYEDELTSQVFYAGASPLTLLRAFATTESAGNEFELRAPESAPPLRKTLPFLLFGVPSVMELLGDGFARGILLPDRRVDVRSFDVVKDGPELARQIRKIIDLTDRPDLSPYLLRGSKLLLWQGLADVTLPPAGTYAYFDRARESALRAGLSPEAFDQAVRLYTAPTIGHCAGGTGPNEADLLGALDQWVTKGKTPGAITVQRRDKERRVLRSRLLCPMPEEPRYLGQGSIDEVSSFVCAIPQDRVGITGLALPLR